MQVAPARSAKEPRTARRKKADFMSANSIGHASRPAAPPHQNRISYPFDATPKWVNGLVKEHRLQPLDVLVLNELLHWRLRFVASCWCTVETIATNLERSPRTISRSLARLSTADLIDQRRVPKPDPDEPRNRTGWRITFLWLAPPNYRRSGRPKGGRPRRESTVQTLSEMTRMASSESTVQTLSEMTRMASSEMTPVSSNLRACVHNVLLDGVERNETTSSSSEINARVQDDDDDSFLTPSIHPEPQTAKPAIGTEQPECTQLTAAVESVRQAHGAEQAEAIRARVPGLEDRLRAAYPTLELDYLRKCILAAIYTTAAKKTLRTSAVAYFASFVLNVPRDWTPAVVNAAIDQSRGQADPELAAALADVKLLKSYGSGWHPSRLRQLVMTSTDWTPERFDRAMARLEGGP
jgi:hypothetical protein